TLFEANLVGYKYLLLQKWKAYFGFRDPSNSACFFLYPSAWQDYVPRIPSFCNHGRDPNGGKLLYAEFVLISIHNSQAVRPIPYPDLRIACAQRNRLWPTNLL